MNAFQSYSAQLFDMLNRFWENSRTERAIGFILLWFYLLTLLAVEAKRLGYFPVWLPQPPSSHYFAIQLAFSLILGLEVISLIFILPASLSRSMSKQLEILTLILLRNAFKELSILPEPIAVDMNNLKEILDIAVSGMGALIVFFCLGIYRRIMQRQNFARTPEMLQKYVANKKILSLCLMIITLGIGLNHLYHLPTGCPIGFFETIYTILIFADIAMVLIAQRYMPCYYAVFRNSGFAIGTLLMRLGIAAPHFFCTGIAVLAALYVLALTWVTNKFRPENPE